MAADGSRGPRPYTQRQLSTLFLRIPSGEFRRVISGRKTEFRASPGKASQLQLAETPTPVVGYTVHRTRGHDARLLVLERTWQEPLGAISAESLAAEGQPDLAHFRRYWMGRTHRAFTPTRKVVVYAIRPWINGDRETFEYELFERLYGSFT